MVSRGRGHGEKLWEAMRLYHQDFERWKSPWEFIIMSVWKRKQNELSAMIPRMIEDAIAFNLKWVNEEWWAGYKDKKFGLEPIKTRHSVLLIVLTPLKLYAPWAEPLSVINLCISLFLPKCFGIGGLSR